MVKYILIGTLLMSCSRYESEKQIMSGNMVIRIIEIDSCEYILKDRGIAHKGNCSNPIHTVQISE